MKIEVEIPDSLFQKVEKVAKKLNISQKKLYSKAIKQFVEKHKYEPDEITAKLNKFYSRTDISFESYWDEK